ncbi:MAG: SDR family oxidoreductase [Patescibacteria group bacterium]|jgi:NAD(P)-dependent dehydrogenase (short-subunit alcohol dehydrogenase family)
MRLNNKVAVVTGASSGLGLAIANLFMAEGAKVIFADLKEAGLELDAAKAVFIHCDVSKKEDVEALMTAVMTKFSRLDIFVNNAGIDSSGGILETTDETWEKTLAVDLTGVFYGTRAAGKLMKEKGIKGSIINIGSIAGLVGFNNTLAYGTAKGGVIQLTRAAALDLAPYGIRINAIAPGVIATNMTKDYLNNPDFKKMVETNTPLGYVGEANDIAQAALYLASDDSRYVTGAILPVDGGWTAR